jgi:hypothetical protein
MREAFLARGAAVFALHLPLVPVSETLEGTPEQAFATVVVRLSAKAHSCRAFISSGRKGRLVLFLVPCE